MMRTFTPYSKTGRVKVPIAQRVRGHCWETSLAAPGRNDYRCLSANQILDPCFARASDAKHGSRTLECLADPWSKAVELRVSQLPKSPPMTTRPWAIVLASGQRCIAATGTATFVAGVGLDYNCSGGVAAALRDLQARQVTALVGHAGGSTLRHTTVRTIWRA